MGLTEMMMNWIPLKILIIWCLMVIVMVLMMVLVVLMKLVVESGHVALNASYCTPLFYFRYFEVCPPYPSTSS